MSILYKSIASRYRHVRVADGPITARCRFIKNASWVCVSFSGYKRTPVSIAGRTLTCFWWLFSLFFLTMYGANLTAFFLRKEPLHHTVPFATFDELSKQTDVKYGIRDIIYVRNYYNYSSNTHVDRRIYKEIMKDPGLMVNSFQEGFDRVRQGNGKYAFIADSPYIGKYSRTSMARTSLRL